MPPEPSTVSVMGGVCWAALAARAVNNVQVRAREGSSRGIVGNPVKKNSTLIGAATLLKLPPVKKYLVYPLTRTAEGVLSISVRAALSPSLHHVGIPSE